ncbi:MAG TPA: IS30 family transposase [Kineosporiaceae bacterium]|nr:IS30 family transposase [Kineosporiaceae bacterium]
MYRPANSSYSKRFLDRDERYEIARLREGGHSIRAIARALGRAPSTISRELARNSAGHQGAYEPQRADALAYTRQRRPKTTVWQRRPLLREVVQEMLKKRLSPEQVSGRLRALDPDNRLMQVSHETIYRALYVHPRGELSRELKAVLRSRRSTRKPHGRQERRGKIPDMVSIHDRPEEVAARLVPGHHEGDLIKGTIASNSAIGTIVERHSGYLTLLHLPDGWAAEKVAAAITTQMSQYPPWFAKTLTWDRGVEMSQHKKITQQTGIQVYFADPHSPQQRPSNENTNGLLREYFPKGTDLSIHDAAHLQEVAAELNDRPRKRLGFLTPAEVFANLQAQAGVATTA